MPRHGPEQRARSPPSPTFQETVSLDARIAYPFS
jgi:hypothetical protein